MELFHHAEKRLLQARGILPMGMPGYNPDLGGYPYNLARARQLQERMWADLDHRQVSGVTVMREWIRLRGGRPGILAKNTAVFFAFGHRTVTCRPKTLIRASHDRWSASRSPNPLLIGPNLDIRVQIA